MIYKNTNHVTTKYSRAVKFALVVVALSVLAASCGSSDDSDQGATTETTTTETTNAISQAETYETPVGLVLDLPVPDVPPGTILKSSELEVVIPNRRLRSNSTTPYKGYNLLYASRSVNNEPIAVTGFIVYPDAEQPEGGWPLLGAAHGTKGLADDCAISIEVDNWVTKYEDFLRAGYAMVFTDYEGLGTPGRHPFLVGESEARGVLDSVRAVQNHGGELGDLEVTDEWFAVGNSQGGHTISFVTEIVEDYAPELNLLGAMIGSPPQPNFLIQNSVTEEQGYVDVRRGYIPMAVAGYDAAYPDMQISESVLSDEVLDNDPSMDRFCAPRILEFYEDFEWVDVLHDNMAEALSIFSRAIIDPGFSPHQVPIIMVHGTADDVVPEPSSQILFQNYCGFDNPKPIIRVPYQGVGHDVIDTAAPDVLAWMDNILAGNPVPSAC